MANKEKKSAERGTHKHPWPPKGLNLGTFVSYQLTDYFPLNLRFIITFRLVQILKTAFVPISYSSHLKLL